MEGLTPSNIVTELDKYIIGQNNAKKSVAIALRNRYRRNKLVNELKEEIVPKNIIMIGPTGVGKTEIARRLSKLVDAPFLKVEATKFTEVGYVGRDVESMVRDLLEVSIRMIKNYEIKNVRKKAKELADNRIIDILVPMPDKNKAKNPLESLFVNNRQINDEESENTIIDEIKNKRRIAKRRLIDGELEEEFIEIYVEENNQQMVDVFSGSGAEEMGINMNDIFGGLFPKKKKKKNLKIKEAREFLTHQEAEKLIDMDEVIKKAIKKTEETGIIFIDEIDKVAGKDKNVGPDVSKEGVQRDILPIIEGSTVVTKHGTVKTDHILFISAGAFHYTKPSDLIPELQGRFPIRVELDNLQKDDFKRILLEPKNAIIRQYTALMESDGIDLKFTDDAIDEIAEIAYRVNNQTENIGARRLYTIMEKLLEDILFKAPDRINENTIEINREYVSNTLEKIATDKDLSMYIL